MTIAEQLKKEGKEESKLEIAKRMIKKGMDVEDVRDVTKLSKEKIQEIKRKAHH